MHAVVDTATRDRDIVVLLGAGFRERAFEQLMQRYEAKIYRLCVALMRNRMAAEDAAQESVVRIWRSLGRYDPRSPLSSWIYAITRNRCFSALQKAHEATSLANVDLTEATHSPAASAESDVNEQSQLLQELVSSLPAKLRQTLLLYYFQDRSVDEAALMLGVPAGTVKTHLFRARAAIAEELKRRGLADPKLWEIG